jgi:hypothetical protein
VSNPVDIEANLTGGSSLTSQAGVRYAVTAALHGSSSVTARGTSRLSARAHLSGGSSLGSRLAYNVSAHLQGSSTLSAAATVNLGGYEAPIRYQEPTRIVTAGKMILENVDLFLSDGKTRVVELPPSELQLKVFCNSDEVNWPLVSGVGINDIRVTAGKVYWTEIADGFYNIRFFPSVLGLWRLILTYRAHDQAVSFTYDVVPKVSVNPFTGVRTSFFKR